MSISSLVIYQDNISDSSNLMPIHSPLIFLVDANYSGELEYIYCKIYNSSDVLLGTYKCIPYRDVTTTQRRFMFIADNILQGYMSGYSDFVQANNTLVAVEDITKEFKLVFSDPDEVAASVELEIVACHGVRQFGDTPNMSEIYNNDTEIVYGYKDKYCYVYFYNDDITNVLALTQEYSVKFIISDSVGFVDNAKVTLDGDVLYTNTSGEVTFYKENGTYNYTIEKTGYGTISSSVIVSSSNVTLPIELTALVLADVTITALLDGLTPINNAHIRVFKTAGVYLIDDYTDALGELSFQLYPDTYSVWILTDPCNYTGRTDSRTVLAGVNSFNAEPASVTEYTITFDVRDELDAPIDAATIVQTISPPVGFSICDPETLTTNVSGIATKLMPEYLTGYSNPYQVYKTGYTTVSGSVVANANKTVYIILNSI